MERLVNSLFEILIVGWVKGGGGRKLLISADPATAFVIFRRFHAPRTFPRFSPNEGFSIRRFVRTARRFVVDRRFFLFFFFTFTSVFGATAQRDRRLQRLLLAIYRICEQGETDDEIVDEQRNKSREIFDTFFLQLYRD